MPEPGCHMLSIDIQPTPALPHLQPFPESCPRSQRAEIRAAPPLSLVWKLQTVKAPTSVSCCGGLTDASTRTWAKTICLFHPEHRLQKHELLAELSSEHATQHPVPILPLLGRAVQQHVPLKMMHGFVMHQRENIKEFNSCTELRGDCIRLIWKVHNTSHMLQEHNSVYSIPLYHCTPLLLSSASSKQGTHGICGVGKANHGAQQSSPHPTKQRFFIPKP